MQKIICGNSIDTETSAQYGSQKYASHEEALYLSPSGICFLEIRQKRKDKTAVEDLRLAIISNEDALKWLEENDMPVFREILKNSIPLITKGN
jgi:hypothetical protein